MEGDSLCNASATGAESKLELSITWEADCGQMLVLEAS